MRQKRFLSDKEWLEKERELGARVMYKIISLSKKTKIACLVGKSEEDGVSLIGHPNMFEIDYFRQSDVNMLFELLLNNNL